MALPARLRRRLKVTALTLLALWLGAVAAVNSAVNWTGGAGVFLLDPRSLGDKAAALAAYAAHRPKCALFGEDDVRRDAVAAAHRNGVDPQLFLSLVETESAFVPHRISWRGAMGPAQLMPATARQLGVSDPFAPAQALDGGARYLREQLDRFGEVRLAVAAYNAGPGAVHGAVPDNGETPAYVSRVMARYAARRAALARADAALSAQAKRPLHLPATKRKVSRRR